MTPKLFFQMAGPNTVDMLAVRFRSLRLKVRPIGC